MAEAPSDPHRNLKIAITVGALGALGVRIVFPSLNIDAVSLGLLLIGVLPWLAPLIKSAEIPGVGKIEFQDVLRAGERVAAGEATLAGSAPTSSKPAYLAIVDRDPNLALTGLRIEIEKRLRELAEHAGVSSSIPLARVTAELQERGILNREASAGLRDLIALGNQAAHGREVGSDVAYWAVDVGPRLLGILDAKLAQQKGAGASA